MRQVSELLNESSLVTTVCPGIWLLSQPQIAQGFWLLIPWGSDMEVYTELQTM